MGMKYDKSMRDRISQDAIGKIVESLEWDDEECYWVMSFTDGTEISFRLMTEI